MLLLPPNCDQTVCPPALAPSFSGASPEQREHKRTGWSRRAKLGASRNLPSLGDRVVPETHGPECQRGISPPSPRWGTGCGLELSSPQFLSDPFSEIQPEPQSSINQEALIRPHSPLLSLVPAFCQGMSRAFLVSNSSQVWALGVLDLQPRCVRSATAAGRRFALAAASPSRLGQ